MLKSSLIAISLTLTPVAAAQDRIPDRTLGPARSQEGIRLLMPGGLLLASYDANKDLSITPSEIQEGARQSFQAADTDQSGSLTPIEQQSWAIRITDQNDPTANPLFFDHDLDRLITEDEFIKGMVKLAAGFPNQDGTIAFIDLTRPPTRDRADRNGDQDRRRQIEAQRWSLN